MSLSNNTAVPYTSSSCSHSDKASSFSNRDTGHGRHGSTGSGSISVFSVSLQDPYFIDLQALKSDHTALYSQLKLAQQVLHHSYQDLIIAQERSKRAETDTGRLRAHLDILLKKHTEHHPERETLVQQLGDLQAQLDMELSSRKTLEYEYRSLQQELLKLKLGYSLQSKSAQHLLPPSQLRSMTGTSSSTSSLFNFNMGGSSHQQNAHQTPTATAPSPTASVRSTSSSTFSSFFTGGSRRKSSITERTSMQSVRMFEKEEVIMQEPNEEEIIDLQGTVTQQQLGTILTESFSSSGALASPVQSFHRSSEEVSVAFESPCLTQEQLEIEKQFYEKLREENVSMKLELQDLRHRNVVEKESIKSYMSLFESLQKKQTNAMAVAQAEVDLLRTTVSESLLRIESRESLIQTFIATVQTQAVDLEQATCEIARERTSRAKVEQEMATLLEASLLMLERCFSNVKHTKLQITKALDPIRQTIYMLEVPSIVEEWDQCENCLQQVMNDLARTIIQEQEFQEMELSEGVVVVGRTTPNEDLSKAKAMTMRHLSSSNNASMSSSTSVSNIGALDLHQRRGSAYSSGYKTFDDCKEGDDQASMLELTNNVSQSVFAWRKSVADSFLEECVQTVEMLARDKRELQTRILELTQAMTELEEKRVIEDATNPHQPEAISENDETALDYNTRQVEQNLPTRTADVEGKEIKDAGTLSSENPATESEADGKKQRLEAIFTQLIALSNRLSVNSLDCKNNAPDGTMEDAVLALDVAESSMRNIPDMELHAPDNEADSLDTLLRMIQQELGVPQTIAFATDITTRQMKVTRSSVESSEQTAASAKTPFTLEDMSPVVPEKSGKKAECPTSISTFRRGSSQSFSTVASISTQSSMSCTSGYFSTAIGGLSTPSSPGMGIGLDGQLLDVGALCKDLAFRSFPKQHQWSKTRAPSARMAVGSSLLLTSASMISLPPLPPTALISTPPSKSVS
ncbi:hypothetical protein BG004_001080 [Podila humilis]|nr:hypothetical protein BG004_001080 [Podila humilis]